MRIEKKKRGKNLGSSSKKKKEKKEGVWSFQARPKCCRWKRKKTQKRGCWKKCGGKIQLTLYVRKEFHRPPSTYFNTGTYFSWPLHVHNYRTWKTGTVIDSSLLVNQRSLHDGKFGIQNSFDNKQVRKISHIIKKITVFQHISLDNLITKMDKYWQFCMISI